MNKEEFAVTATNTHALIASAVLVQNGMELVDGRIDDIYVGVEVTTFFSGGSSSFYGRRGVEKIRVEVGNCNTGRNNFKMHKDGSFNIEKIAERIIEKREQIVAQKAERTRKEDRNAQLRTAKRIVDLELGLKEYDGSVTAGKYSLEMKLRANHDQTDAVIQVLELAKKLGLRTGF